MSKRKAEPIRITAYVPVELEIPAERLDELLEMHVEHWDGDIALEEGCSEGDLVLQAIKASIIDEADIGGDWVNCNFSDDMYYHSSVENES